MIDCSWIDGFAFNILAYKFANRALDPANFTKVILPLIQIALLFIKNNHVGEFD